MPLKIVGASAATEYIELENTNKVMQYRQLATQNCSQPMNIGKSLFVCCLHFRFNGILYLYYS